MNPFIILKLLEVNLIVFMNISKISCLFVFYCFVLYLKQEGGHLETSTTNCVVCREEN